MNTVILGGTSGLGLEIAREFPDALLLGRSHFNLLSGEWVMQLKTAIEEKFKHVDNVELIVIAAYDRRHEQENAQLTAFRVLYRLFREKKTMLAVIGDMVHHIEGPRTCLYNANKRDVYSAVLETVTDTKRVCPILLYEPRLRVKTTSQSFRSEVESLTEGDFKIAIHSERPTS